MEFRNARMVPVRVPAALIATALGITLAGCSVPTATGSDGPADTPAAVRAPAEGVLALSSDDPAELALHASQALFGRSPVVVLADAADDSDRMTAAATGEALAAPVLLDGGAIADSAVTKELERLGTEAVVVVGDERQVADAGALVGGRDVVRFDPDAVSEAAEKAVASVTSTRREEGGSDKIPDASTIDPTHLRELRAQVPDVENPERLSEVMLLIDPAAGQEAAIGTARAAGAVPTLVPGGDPGASGDTIDRIATADPLGVVAVGPGFDDGDRLAWQVEAARNQVVHPHGTQRLTGHTYVATTFAAGDDPATTAAEAASTAEMLGGMPAVTVTAGLQSGDPGDDGNYVDETPVEELAAVVEALRETGVLVLLDLVPGNRPLADQLDALEPLLAKPGVGVALHPEFRRAGNGAGVDKQVTVGELQTAVDRVASIVGENGLPQTMVVVHQSTASSVTDRVGLEARPQVLTVFAAAGPSGGGSTQPGVWQDVTSELPQGAAAGWTGTTPLQDPVPPALLTVD